MVAPKRHSSTGLRLLTEADIERHGFAVADHDARQVADVSLPANLNRVLACGHINQELRVATRRLAVNQHLGVGRLYGDIERPGRRLIRRGRIVGRRSVRWKWSRLRRSAARKRSVRWQRRSTADSTHARPQVDRGRRPPAEDCSEWVAPRQFRQGPMAPSCA